MEAHAHPPEAGKPKNITQTISLIVGFVLFVIGLAGILYPSFAGLHMSTFHATVVAIAGATLFYNGHNDNDRNSFISCLCFGLFFLLHAVAGFAFGQSGTSGVGDTSPDPQLLRFIPNFTELGTVDHVLNGIIGVVLLGGALDWRIHHERRRWNRHDRRRERYNRLAHR